MVIGKVSIIIPTFNYGHLLSETLSYLQTQTYQFWEAIIIDDGSTDHTESIVQSFIQSDKRFRYLKQANQGVAIARNNGLKLATGTYIQFLDADDLISKDKLTLQINFLLAHPDIDICVVAAKFFESTDKQMFFDDFALGNRGSLPPVEGYGPGIISNFIQRNLLVIQSPLCRRSVVDKIGFFKEGMHYLEDWDFWFRAAIANLHFGFLDNNLALGLVRVHKNSASQQSIKIIEAEILLRDLIRNSVLQSDLDDSQKKSMAITNEKLRLSTYKKLMALTPLSNVQQFAQYYRQMNSTLAFMKAFFKSLNLRRKVIL